MFGAVIFGAQYFGQTGQQVSGIGLLTVTPEYGIAKDVQIAIGISPTLSTYTEGVD